MKRVYILLVGLALGVMLNSCEQDTPMPLPEEFTPVYLEQTLTSFDFTVKDALLALLEELGLDSEVQSSKTLDKVQQMLQKTLNRTMRAVAITYKTEDPFGNPVIASGAFYYPLDLKPKGVIEVPPIAHMDNYHGSAIAVMNGSFMEEAIPILAGYITINPDLLGTLTTQEYKRPYLHAASTGKVAYHMRKAVEEYLLMEEGYQLEDESIIMGYSLGGSAALAMGKYYDENVPSVKVKEICTGGGVYDAPTAFKAYAKSYIWDYPAIPYVILAMNQYYQLDLDFNGIFKGALADPDPNGDGYAYWFDDTHSSMEIQQRWGSDLRAYMHPDFFAELFTGEFAKLRECLEENSMVYKWTPPANTRIKLVHSGEDNLIPVDCADLLYKVYKSKGVDISYQRIDGDHYEAATEFIADILLYLILK